MSNKTGIFFNLLQQSAIIIVWKKKTKLVAFCDDVKLKNEWKNAVCTSAVLGISKIVVLLCLKGPDSSQNNHFYFEIVLT